MFYKWSPVSSDLCLVEAITRSRVLCQCNPVGGSNQGLGRQDASSWATGNSLGTDKFGNRLGIVLRHDPPCFFDALFGDGQLNWTKLILTFAVPYCVATYGAVSFRLSRSQDEREPGFLRATNGAK